MTSTDTRILGVIFDMDGVLCDSEPFIRQAAQRMFRERYDLSVPDEDFLPFVGAGENRFIGGPAEKHGVTIDIADDKARTYEIYLQIIRERLQPLPGVREFVQRCRTRGVQLAVATAADRVKMEGNLRELGLAPEMFDTLVTGTDVTRHKPDPEAFLKAAAGLRRPAERCLVVEDAVNGVKAAKNAGARCLGLSTTFDPETLRAAGADWVVPHLGETPHDVYDLLGSDA